MSNWFVRPYGNIYGSDNGTSYDDAWNNFASVVWGAGGVIAGDTLWICGVHDSDFGYNDTYLTVGANGTSSNHITIRGDCSSLNPAYPDGVIWFLRAKYAVGFSWGDPDEYGVYSTSQSGNSNDLPAIEDQTTILTNAGKSPDGTWSAGSYWHDTGGGTFYYKPTSGAANTHLVYSSIYAYSLQINSVDYIDVKNLTWNMSGASAVAVTDSEYVTLENLNIQFGASGIIVNNDGDTYLSSHNCSIINSTIHEAGDGIYFVTDSSVTDMSTYWTISGNTIYNINRADIVSYDRHAIGIQGCRNFTISNNTIYDIGGPSPASDKAAIDLYAHPNFYVDNNSVTKNLIYNALYGGILLETNNSCDPNKMKNNIFAYNIVKNGGSSGYGIAWKSIKATDDSPSVKIYNNTVYNCCDSYVPIEYASPGDNYYTSFDFRNNLSISPINRHIYYGTGGTNKDWSYVTMNNNSYYPDGPYFKWDGTDGRTFAQFVALLTNVIGAEANSLTSNPRISSTSTLKIGPKSPCINAGVSVGLTTDYWGTVVPQSSNPDIGACEYRRKPTMIKK